MRQHEIRRAQEEIYVRYSPFSGQRLKEAAPLAGKYWRGLVHRWAFDPWSGDKRDAAAVKKDPRGLKIIPARVSDAVIEALAASNEILSEIPWVRHKPGEQKEVVRVGLPQAYYKKLGDFLPLTAMGEKASPGLHPIPDPTPGFSSAVRCEKHPRYVTTPFCPDCRTEEEIARAGALGVQVGGNHYKDLAIQPIEYIHKNGIGFAEGSVIKYVSRWRAKGGVQDLRKARHFLDLLIEMEEKK